METYIVAFFIDGHRYVEEVRARSSAEARKLIELRYSGSGVRVSTVDRVR